eukprot:15444748-Alexandrium_andersonii.AAC.1
MPAAAPACVPKRPMREPPRRGERERGRSRRGGEGTSRGERSWRPPSELIENCAAKSASASARCWRA